MVTLGVTETISWGVLYYAFTVYLAPMEAELGWSRGDMTGAFSLAVLLAGLAAIPVGRWLDRHGPRLLMTVAILFARAGALGLVFRDPRLVFELGQERRQLCDLGDDSPYPRQLAVGLLDGIGTEPLHGSTI